MKRSLGEHTDITHIKALVTQIFGKNTGMKILPKIVAAIATKSSGRFLHVFRCP